jgi:hypothetical protein
MHPREKAAILKGLKAEEAARLREQDTYRAILKRIGNSPPPGSLSEDFEAIVWEDIEKHMEGQCWPPTSQDWMELDGREYYETSKQVLLNQITDHDIRLSVNGFQFPLIAGVGILPTAFLG